MRATLQVDFKTLINNLSTLLKPEINEVNNIIMEKMQSDVSLIPAIGSHIINSGGKRIRPLLTILTAKALGYTQQKSILIAACIEFIHTATLLHDDVVDETKARRGIETANEIWGNKYSVLVGDYLFSKAFELMVQTDSMAILEVLSKASSTIAQGEVMQLSNTNNIDLSEQEYINIVYCKTGSLFEAATKVAAMLAAPEQSVIGKDQIEKIASYGKNLGIIFQISDDILDYFGQTEKTGKQLGTDLKEGKLTLPVILTLKLCNQQEKQEIIRIFKDLNQKDNDFELMLSYFEKYNIIKQCYAFAEPIVQQGLSDIDFLKNNQYTTIMTQLLINGLTRKA
jgi:octaprenyl-diphosphate synthase